MDRDLSIILFVWVKIKVVAFVCSIRYRFKFCLHFCFTAVALWFTVFCAIFKWRFRDSRNFYLTAKLLMKLAELLGVQVVVECSEILDKTEKFIVIMNHQSCLDVFPMCHVGFMLGDLAPVAREVMKYVPPFGLAICAGDGMFLQNRTKHASRKALDDKMNSLRARKRNIVIFPEGTRSDGDQLLPFKKGAFHLSVQSGMRVLPVAIQKYPFIDHHKKIFGRGVVKVKILDPIEKKTGENVDEFVTRVYDVMSYEFKQLNCI